MKAKLQCVYMVYAIQLVVTLHIAAFPGVKNCHDANTSCAYEDVVCCVTQGVCVSGIM